MSSGVEVASSFLPECPEPAQDRSHTVSTCAEDFRHVQVSIIELRQLWDTLSVMPLLGKGVRLGHKSLLHPHLPRLRGLCVILWLIVA